jgi:hypothetical protein
MKLNSVLSVSNDSDSDHQQKKDGPNFMISEKQASNDQGNKKGFDSKAELRKLLDKSKRMFNDSDDADAMLEAGEGSEEIDEGFLQVTAYNFRRDESQAAMNASQDLMQMPHEGDESDSSSSDEDRRKNQSYSDMDSHEYENDGKDSSDYSEQEYDHRHLGNISDDNSTKSAQNK